MVPRLSFSVVGFSCGFLPVPRRHSRFGGCIATAWESRFLVASLLGMTNLLGPQNDGFYWGAPRNDYAFIGLNPVLGGGPLPKYVCRRHVYPLPALP